MRLKVLFAIILETKQHFSLHKNKSQNGVFLLVNYSIALLCSHITFELA
jgi:hypothetical protein